MVSKNRHCRICTAAKAACAAADTPALASWLWGILSSKAQMMRQCEASHAKPLRTTSVVNHPVRKCCIRPLTAMQHVRAENNAFVNQPWHTAQRIQVQRQRDSRDRPKRRNHLNPGRRKPHTGSQAQPQALLRRHPAWFTPRGRGTLSNRTAPATLQVCWCKAVCGNEAWKASIKLRSSVRNRFTISYRKPSGK
jgi:hypothetical protein